MMSSSYGSFSDSGSPNRHLTKVVEQEEVSPVFSSFFNSCVVLDGGPVCIPSPYADNGNKDYGHAELGALAFYGSSVPENPTMAPPLSPSLFWPSHSTHTIACPPSLTYSKHAHSAWAETKPHTEGRNSSFLHHGKLYGNSMENTDEGLSSSTSMDIVTKSDMHFCVVCNDYASGYHYGVWSCEGCKAFFKRSIQGHNDYICPATNQCTIDKNRRKSCQACRLRKCYEVGMMKCGIRRERCGYRGSRHRRAQQIRDSSFKLMGVRGHGQHQAPLHLTLSLPDSKVSVESRLWGLSPEQLVHCIMEAEPPQIYLRQQIEKPYTESSVMMSLTHLADKELVLMISWAKKIPGFVELNLSHQVQLLECCWLEVLMLGLMWRSVDDPGNLIFSPDLKLNREEWSCVEGIMEIFDMLLAGSSRLRELKLQKEEYVCLKTLILLNSSLYMTSSECEEEMESRAKLLRLLDAVTDSLVWAISRMGLSMQQQSARLAHLLMLLSHIRHLSNKGMEHLSTMKRRNVVLLYDLLLEMLDANTAQSKRLSNTTSDPEVTTPLTPPNVCASSLANPITHRLMRGEDLQKAECSQE